MSNTAFFTEYEPLAANDAIRLMKLAVPLWQHFEDIANGNVCVDNEEPRKSHLHSKTQIQCSDTNDQLYWLVTGLQEYLDPTWQESIHEWIDFDPLGIFVEEKA